MKGDGIFETENGTLSCHAGDLLYMPDSERYRSVWTGSPAIEFLSLFFRFYTANDSIDMHNIDNLHLLPIDRRFMFQRIDAMSRFSKQDDMLTVINCWQNGQEGQLQALSIIYGLLSEAYPLLKHKKERSTQSAIRPAIQYMKNHLNENHHTSFYADMCHISEVRFYQLFASTMHCTPLEYRNTLRMYKAVTLLLQTDLSIEEISSQIGYDSPEYFRRVFARYYHTTPSRFRRQNMLI